MSFLTSMRPTLRATPMLARPLAGSQQSRALSKFTIVGRLAANPELVTTSGGRELVRYAVGTSHGKGDAKTTSWWKVAAFPNEGPGRDFLLGLGKGSLVYVEGDASMRKFEREGRTETGLSLIQTRYDVLERREPSEASEAESSVIEEQ